MKGLGGSGGLTLLAELSPPASLGRRTGFPDAVLCCQPGQSTQFVLVRDKPLQHQFDVVELCGAVSVIRRDGRHFTLSLGHACSPLGGLLLSRRSGWQAGRLGLHEQASAILALVPWAGCFVFGDSRHVGDVGAVAVRAGRRRRLPTFRPSVCTGSYLGRFPSKSCDAPCNNYSVPVSSWSNPRRVATSTKS